MMTFKAIFTKGTMTGNKTSEQVFEFEAKTLRGAKMKASNLAGYVSVSDSLRLYDEHGTQIDVKTHEEWLYGTTEMPEQIYLKPETEDDEPAAVEEPTLMTYSYFHGEGAIENPMEAYIDDIIVCDRKNADRLAGYVFYQWVHVAKGLVMFVKPSEKLLERANQVMGYPIVAMVPRTLQDGTVRLVGTFKTDLPGFSHDSVLGDMSVEDAARVQEISEHHKIEAMI